MKNYSFDNIIKEKAAAHEAPVPAAAWNNIKKQKKKKRYGAFWWSFGIILLLGIGIFGIYQNGQPEKITLADNKTVIEKGSANISSKEENIKPGDSQANVASKLNSKDSSLNDMLYSKEVIPVSKPASNDQGKSDISAVTDISSVPKQKLNISRSEERSKARNGFKKKTVEEEDINISDETIDITTAILSVQKEKLTDQLSKAAKGNKQVKSKIKISTQAPGIDDGNNKAVLADKEENRVEDVAVNVAPDNIKDSIQIKPEIKKQIVVTDTNRIVVKQNDPKKKKQRSFFIDISTTPFLAIQKNASISSISRTTLTPSLRSEFIADEITTTVNPSFSYTLALRKNISKKLQLGLGVQYTQLKETVRLSGKETNTNYSVIKRLDNSGSFLVNDTVATITKGLRIINATNSYEIISIPVFVQYNLFEKRSWALSLSGGLNFNISNIYKNSIDGKLVPKYGSQSMADKKEHTVTTDVFAAIRLSRTMGNKFQLYAEPTLQFNLMRYNMRNMINYKNIHRAGLTIGIAYQLKF